MCVSHPRAGGLAFNKAGLGYLNSLFNPPCRRECYSSSRESVEIDLESEQNSRRQARWDEPEKGKGQGPCGPHSPAGGAHPLRGGAPPGASCLLLPSGGPETGPPLQAPGPMEPQVAPAGPGPYGKGGLGLG